MTSSDAEILNIVLPTDDLESTRHSFEQQLSFPVHHASARSVFYDCGSVYLAIHETDPDSPFADRSGLF